MTRNRNNTLSVISFAAFLVLINFVSGQGLKVPKESEQAARSSSFIPKKIKPVNDQRIVKKIRMVSDTRT